MDASDKKLVRLLVPHWQGGASPAYVLGARLLEWLAPASSALTIDVPVPSFSPEPLPKEEGLVGRKAVIEQIEAINLVLEAHRPDRVVVFGGDCMVDQAPFAYLNERYDGKLGVLWLDAHPDVATTEHRDRAHTMILGNLLGKGDVGLSHSIKVPVASKRVAMVGLAQLRDYERQRLDELGVNVIGPEALREDNAAILRWIEEAGIRHLAIHLDLDVLSPEMFRAQGFAVPLEPLSEDGRKRAGYMTFEQVARIIEDVSATCEVVGLGITEHMPWDAQNLQNMLARFPILKG